VAPRLAELVRKARRLSAERDRLIDGLAAEWTRALRGQRFSAADLDELWAGLTEEAVRRAGKTEDLAEGGAVAAQAWRREAQEVIARLREKVEAQLGAS
jgi:hypothetical protein